MKLNGTSGIELYSFKLLLNFRTFNINDYIWYQILAPLSLIPFSTKCGFIPSAFIWIKKTEIQRHSDECHIPSQLPWIFNFAVLVMDLFGHFFILFYFFLPLHPPYLLTNCMELCWRMPYPLDYMVMINPRTNF